MKRIYILIFMILSSFSFGDIIRIANFNALRLGENKKNYNTMAKIVSNFDIIGLEEVINEKGVKILVNELNKQNKEKWNYKISTTPVGTRKYKEYYAVVYKEKAVNSIKYIGNYPVKEFIRPPAAFQIKSKNFDFVVILAHSIYGDDIKYRVREANKYAKVYKYFQNKTNEEDIILMGDFNLPAKNKAFESLLELGVVPILDSDIYKTTMSNNGLANSYDNIFINLSALREFNNTYGAYNFAKGKNYKHIRKYISDHIIVFAEFDNDKDLDR